MQGQGLVCFLLGVIVTLLAVLVLRGDAMPQAMAGGASDGFIMTTAADGSLFIYDVKNQKLAYYSISRTDGRLRLSSARNTQYDLKVRDEIADSKGFTFSDMEKKFKKAGE